MLELSERKDKSLDSESKIKEKVAKLFTEVWLCKVPAVSMPFEGNNSVLFRYLMSIGRSVFGANLKRTLQPPFYICASGSSGQVCFHLF